MEKAWRWLQWRGYEDTTRSTVVINLDVSLLSFPLYDFSIQGELYDSSVHKDMFIRNR
mgnify:CR=1 FL=1